MAKKNQIKNWVIPTVAGGVVIILMAASIISGSIQQKREKEGNAASVSVDRINLKDDSAQAQQVNNTKTEVEIQFEDCAIPVGTQLKMTALVIPENTEQALIWNCSDTSVAEIDKDGILTIRAEGTAVITATLGTVSDSVMIEGITDVVQGSKNNLSVYTGTTLAKGETSASNYSNGSSSDVSPSDGNSSSNQSSGSSSNGNGEDTKTPDTSGSGVNGTVSNNSGSDGTGQNTSANTSQNNSNSTGSSDNNSSNNSTTGEDSTSGSSSNGNGYSGNTDTVNDELSQIGFTQRYSNVYVCEENGTYYGEIITQPNVTIIYIKQRSTEFDSRIQTVLQRLLPEEYGQVWSNYLSASTDRTFTAEDRKVRIVAAPNGGHTQIVIYN